MKTAIAAALMAAFCGAATLSASQSLADLAKKEEARRVAVRAASKKLTNADLGADPREAPPSAATVDKAPTASMAAAAPGNASADAQAAAQPGAVAAAKEDGQPEAWWRSRAQMVRSRLVTTRKAVAELTGPPSDDELQRAKVAKLLKSAQEALGRAENDLRTLEMNADVARIPKAWIQ